MGLQFYYIVLETTTSIYNMTVLEYIRYYFYTLVSNGNIWQTLTENVID